jgi:DNA polymerase-3 subunit gamma/tau
MANMALYRKHRPQSFAQLVGQEALSAALRNAIREGRVGHAYLFSGQRGTGKTTTARLLAKALNCTTRGEDGEPCNACTSCEEITGGTSIDVLELDAASNRGIGEMRSLLERVSYRSAGGARKVYIIDEVHQLTKEASAALLKTLEEPPDHVVFVLATTDPQMVPSTIRSRSQHFEFSLLPQEQLAAHLADIAAREAVEAEPEALDIVARRAGGSVRDALSLLDQVLAYDGRRLQADQVRALLGGTPFDQRAEVVEALAGGDVPALLERLDDLFRGGVDARTFTDDLLRHLRDAFLVTCAGPNARTDLPEEERKRLADQGATLGGPALVRALETLGEAAIEIRRAPDPRLVLEVALVRIARRDVTTLDALADRLARLEQALAGGPAIASATGPAPAAAAAPSRAAAAPPPPERAAPPPERPAAPAGAAADRAAGPRAALGALKANAGRTPQAPPPSPAADVPGSAQTATPPAPAPAPAPQEAPEPSPPVAAPDPAAPAPAPVAGGGAVSLPDVQRAWPEALESLKPRLRAMAKEASPVRVEGTKIVLSLPAKYSKVHLPTITGDAAAVAAALGQRLGTAVTIAVELEDQGGTAPAVSGGGTGPDTEDEDFGEAFDPPGGGGGRRLDSPVELAINAFGATVESETIRD